MTFTLETWRAQAGRKLEQVGRWLERRRRKDLPYVAYSTVAGLSLWPLVEAAAQSGQFWPVVGAMYGVAGSVGGNLIANQLEALKNRAEQPAEEEVADWVATKVGASDELRQALDAILEALEALATAQASLSEADKAWFTAALRQEMAQLGNLERFAATLTGGGAIAQGPGSTAVGYLNCCHCQKVSYSYLSSRGLEIISTDYLWEWCHNKYNDRAATAVDGSADTRVVRFGSWASPDGTNYR